VIEGKGWGNEEQIYDGKQKPKEEKLPDSVKQNGGKKKKQKQPTKKNPLTRKQKWGGRGPAVHCKA